MEKSEYISKWIDTSITLSEWRENSQIDHWDIIEQMGLNDNEIEEIEQHQLQLFNEAVEIKVKNAVKRHFDLPLDVRNEVFKEHLRLIDLFTKSIEVNTVIIDLLAPITFIVKKDYVGVLKKWQRIIAHRYDDFRTDHSINESSLKTQLI